MEVIPGVSPYNQTEEEVKEFLRKIRGVLEYCADNKFEFATLLELYPYFFDHKSQAINHE